jgi:putative ATPase
MPDDSMELFPDRPKRRVDPRAPLADRMRPASFEEMLGQGHLTHEGSALRSMLAGEELPSLILWGPPGTGKTTLAWLLAGGPNMRMEPMSAVTSGVKDIREAVERARHVGLRTVLFIDEIHRLNRAQQDVLLPHVEAGTVTLIGATTENPSFTVNAPLLSRCRVLTLKPLDDEALARTVERAAADPERGLGKSPLALGDGTVGAIVQAADGDARRALGLLEAAAAVHRQSDSPGSPLIPETVREAAGRRLLLHDRDREEHFNVASAFIKSLRASDPDASVYYLIRMLEAGEDPLYPARRLVIFASEDIGNADPQALQVATSAFLAVERIGVPEGRLILTQAPTYLACAPKSNAALTAMVGAQQAIAETGSAPVPLHLRNAPTPLMKDLGYGSDYHYPHSREDAFVADENLPEALAGRRFYEPANRGAERAIAERLEEQRRRRKQATASGDGDASARPPAGDSGSESD